MKFGLSDQEYQFVSEHIVSPLQSMGAKIWVYGSRARGDHRKFSDLDLMVDSTGDLSAQIGAIQEKISESNFPYKVDIVQYSDFAESYKPGYLKDRVSFGDF